MLGSKGQTTADSAAKQNVQGQRWFRQPTPSRHDVLSVVVLAVFAGRLKQLPGLRLLKEAPAGHKTGRSAVLERQSDVARPDQLERHIPDACALPC